MSDKECEAYEEKRKRKTSDEVITQMKSSGGKETRNRYTVE